MKTIWRVDWRTPGTGTVAFQNFAAYVRASSPLEAAILARALAARHGIRRLGGITTARN